MRFKELDRAIQDMVRQMVDEHLQASIPILARDKELLPMMQVRGNCGNQLVMLQSAGSDMDVGKAYAAAVSKLKGLDFDCALFSYSTQIGLGDGRWTTALKSVVMTKAGLAVSIFVPYEIKGLFKKQVHCGQMIVQDVQTDAFGQDA